MRKPCDPRRQHRHHGARTWRGSQGRCGGVPTPGAAGAQGAAVTRPVVASRRPFEGCCALQLQPPHGLAAESSAGLHSPRATPSARGEEPCCWPFAPSRTGARASGFGQPCHEGCRCVRPPSPGHAGEPFVGAGRSQAGAGRGCSRRPRRRRTAGRAARAPPRIGTRRRVWPLLAARGGAQRLRPSCSGEASKHRMQKETTPTTVVVPSATGLQNVPLLLWETSSTP